MCSGVCMCMCVCVCVYLCESGSNVLQCRKIAIEQVMQHDLTEKSTKITLERMSVLASHETTVRALLQVGFTFMSVLASLDSTVKALTQEQKAVVLSDMQKKVVDPMRAYTGRCNAASGSVYGLGFMV